MDVLQVHTALNMQLFHFSLLIGKVATHTDSIAPLVMEPEGGVAGAIESNCHRLIFTCSVLK